MSLELLTLHDEAYELAVKKEGKGLTVGKYHRAFEKKQEESLAHDEALAKLAVVLPCTQVEVSDQLANVIIAWPSLTKQQREAFSQMAVALR